jgi:hypothetical protein
MYDCVGCSGEITEDDIVRWANSEVAASGKTTSFTCFR